MNIKSTTEFVDTVAKALFVTDPRIVKIYNRVKSDTGPSNLPGGPTFDATSFYAAAWNTETTIRNEVMAKASELANTPSF